MTVSKLHKLLGEMIARGHGRKPVCVDKATFQHNCEADGVTILDVCKVKLISHWIDDGDGCAIINKDGTERQKTSFVLLGDLAE